MSGVAVSNYSSLLNHCYYSGRPTVHIDPTPSEGRTPYFRKLKWGFVQKRAMKSPQAQWKLPPTEVDGLRARSFEELVSAIELALRDPSCCVQTAQAFTDGYIARADGGTRSRTTDVLRAWVSGVEQA